MSATAGSIYFSVDGSVPTNASTPYTGALSVSSPTQINAVAYQSGVYSAVSTVYLDVDSSLGPELQTGLILRLRAGLGVSSSVGNPPPVVTWYDLSGSANNASVSAPNCPLLTPNPISQPAVSFDGSSQFLSLPSGFSTFTGTTAFIVAQPSSIGSTQRLLDLGNSSTGDDVALEFDGSGHARLGIYSGGTGTFASSQGTATANRFQIIEVVQTSASPYTATVYTDGIPGTPNASMNNISTVTRASNFIGKSSNSTNPFGGKIYEILLYNTALTASQRGDIRTVLLRKYQPTGQPDSPVFNLAAGSLSAPANIAITTARECGIIRFTTDGTTPNASSQVYLAPVPVYYSQTLKAVNVLGGSTSPTTSAAYTLNATTYPAPDPNDHTPPTINISLPTATH